MRHQDPAAVLLEHDDVLLRQRAKRVRVVDVRRRAGVGECREDRAAERELSPGQAASCSIAAVYDPERAAPFSLARW
jgi:hypothetical protein